MTGVVYLVHFERKFKHAGHYVGSAKDLLPRILRHRSGSGSRLLYHAQTAGIRWYVVRTWRTDEFRALEAKFKRRRHNTVLCPVCAGKRDLLKVARRWPACNRILMEA